MKLIVKYKNKLKNTKFLPRDIRNLLGSITKEMPEINSKIMWHEHKQPPIIYTIPSFKSFAIVSYIETSEMKMVFEILKSKLLDIGEINIKGEKVAIDTVFIKEYRYCDFKHGLFENKIRTPLVIASSKVECLQAKQISEDIVKNKEQLEKFATKLIKESLRFQNKDWFDIEDFEVDDLELFYKDLEYFVVKYSDKQTFPAIRGTIISNRRLPSFLGYKVGMGYGELENAYKPKKAK